MLLHKDLYSYIVNYFEDLPLKITVKNCKRLTREVKNISLINKRFNLVCRSKLEKLKEIFDLLEKYYVYNKEYEDPGMDYRTSLNFAPQGNPQLLDAVSTGCDLPFTRSSFKIFPKEIEEDIAKIIKLTPQSMNCLLGTLRCRDFVPPLAVACFNKNIPLRVIKFLLESGADPNATYMLNGVQMSILYDLHPDNDRKSDIEKLFVQFGSKKI